MPIEVHCENCGLFEVIQETFGRRKVEEFKAKHAKHICPDGKRGKLTVK